MPSPSLVLPVQAIDMVLVLKVIEPIWTTKPETAGRLRGRLESILDWARARSYRKGESPARWRGHIDKALSARSKVRKVKHQAALAYAELPKCIPVQSSLPAYRSGVVLDFRSVYIARRGLACSPPIRLQKQRASGAWRLSYFIRRVLRLEMRVRKNNVS